MRTRLERMSLMRYKDLIESKRFTDHIHNGHILVYTRINPDTGEIAPNFRYTASRSDKGRWIEASCLCLRGYSHVPLSGCLPSFSASLPPPLTLPLCASQVDEECVSVGP